MSTDLSNLLEQASGDLERGEFARAVIKYRQAIQSDPCNEQAYQGLGEGLSRLKRVDEAIEACQQALELNPGLAVSHAVLGSIYGRRRKYAEAEAELKKALELDPDLFEAYISLGALEDVRERFAEAEVELKKAIELNPKAGTAYYNLSLVCSRQGRFNQALNMAQMAFRLKPSINSMILLTLTFFGKYPVATSLLAALFYIMSFATRSLLTFPLIATLVGIFLVNAMNRPRDRKASQVLVPLLIALFLLTLYILNILFGPFFSLPSFGP